MTDMKKFFTALSERAYKENDLSDVTYAMCESDICFKQFFLNFFFAKYNLDASSTSIEREHSTDWGRPDFFIRTKKGVLYIVEVKIWDGHHHFERYYDILAGKKDGQEAGGADIEDRDDVDLWNRLGYIANYESIKDIEVAIGKGKQSAVTGLCKVATWKEFVKAANEKDFKDPIITAYVQYVRNVCPFDDFILQDWLKDQKISGLTKAFQEIRGVSISISQAIKNMGEFDETINFKSYTRSSRKFVPQYRMGSFFEFDLPNDLPDVQKQRVWGWFGIYYRNGGGVICVEFEDREGWGKPVCDKFRSSVKDGGLRLYLKEETLDYDNIQKFLKNVVRDVIKGSVGDDCLVGEDGAKQYKSLLAMKAFPIMLEQKLFGASTAITIGGDSYKFSLVSGSEAEVPESHCGRYFELTKSDQNLSEQKTSVRGWIGVMYSANHEYKNGKKYSEYPQFVIEIEKNFANARLKDESKWYDDSWGWKCYDIPDGPLCNLTNVVTEALKSLSNEGAANEQAV